MQGDGCRRVFLLGCGLLWTVGACGSSWPPRAVLERDIEGWAFRRYQQVLDVEFPVAGNRAVGHTASYLRRHGARVDVAVAFVTVYERAAGLAEALRRQLDTLTGYERTVVERHGEHVWRLDGGDVWYLWVRGARIVKVGSPEGEPPDALLEAYLDLYESDLQEHGRAEEGAPSAGSFAEEGAEEAGEPPDPVLDPIRSVSP